MVSPYDGVGGIGFPAHGGRVRGEEGPVAVTQTRGSVATIDKSPILLTEIRLTLDFAPALSPVFDDQCEFVVLALRNQGLHHDRPGA